MKLACGVSKGSLPILVPANLKVDSIKAAHGIANDEGGCVQELLGGLVGRHGAAWYSGGPSRVAQVTVAM